MSQIDAESIKYITLKQKHYSGNDIVKSALKSIWTPMSWCFYVSTGDTCKAYRM